jgi:hypothetical protein
VNQHRKSPPASVIEVPDEDDLYRPAKRPRVEPPFTGPIFDNHGRERIEVTEMGEREVKFQ